jgi:hypothetical protein
MNLRDLLSPNLAGETRLQTAEPVLCRVFTNEHYDVYLCRYPELVTAMVHYKKDALRIMVRVWEGEALPAGEAWTDATLKRLGAQGRTPHHLFMAGKLECGLQLTLHDRAALRLAGVEVPRSAGRYKDLF